MTEYEFQAHLIKCLDFIRFSNADVTDDGFIRTCRAIGGMTPEQLMEATDLGGEPVEGAADLAVPFFPRSDARGQAGTLHQRRLEAARRDAREREERKQRESEAFKAALLRKTPGLPRPKQSGA